MRSNWRKPPIKDGTFALPGKKALKKKSPYIQYIAADVTEVHVNRQKEGENAYYSGKKRHALKTQSIIERKSKNILGVQEAKGSVHDLTAYKDSIGSSASNSIGIDAGLGYLGIQEYHANSYIPIKSSKNYRLSKAEKAHNKKLAESGLSLNASTLK